jgi:hypothetical protein
VGRMWWGGWKLSLNGGVSEDVLEGRKDIHSPLFEILFNRNAVKWAIEGMTLIRCFLSITLDLHKIENISSSSAEPTNTVHSAPGCLY